MHGDDTPQRVADPSAEATAAHDLAAAHEAAEYIAAGPDATEPPRCSSASQSGHRRISECDVTPPGAPNERNHAPPITAITGVAAIDDGDRLLDVTRRGPLARPVRPKKAAATARSHG